MKKNFFAAIAFAASVLLMGCQGGSGTTAGTGGGAVTLKFNMDKGSKFEYTMDMDMKVKQDVSGQTMDVTSKITMGYIFEVTGDSAGWKTLTSTINKIAMDMNGGGMSMKFDTDNPSASDTAGPMSSIGKLFAAMKGGQFSFTMNEKGEVGSVSGIKEMMQRAMTAANVPDAASMMQNMGKAFDEDNFKQNIQQSFAIYPDKPVKPGDTWTKTINMNTSGMIMKADNTYTLESVTGDNAKIKVSSKLGSGGDSTAVAGVQMNMSGTMDGDMTYDIPTGMPAAGDLNMKMSMKVKAGSQEVPVTMDMKMTITGKKM